MNSHSVATSAATGSISTLLVWLARDLLGSQGELVLPPLPTPVDFQCSDSDLIFWKGVLCGFLGWPLLEALLLLKQWFVLCLRQRLSKHCGERLYRVL